MKKLSLILAFIFILIGGCACCAPQPQINENPIKNVIILIGDGMGFNHIKNTSLYCDIDNFEFEKDLFSDVTTYSLNQEITDSAAAATALATGHKVYNYEVGMHKVYGEEEGVKYENIMEVAQKYGKKTGIFTSDALEGATPASFSSHVEDRGDNYEILYDQAYNSGIDLFVASQGSSIYEENKDLFENNNYKQLDTLEDLENLEKNEKGIAVFNNLCSYYDENEKNVTNFNTALTYTLNYLDNENGFCLMIENAWIDKRSHNNKLNSAMCEVRMFADTIKLLKEFCKDRTDTSVFITADHETGGLQLAKTKDQLTNSLYTRTGHSAANVPLYTINVPFEKRVTVNNTDIFAMMKTLMTGNKYFE